MHIEDFILRVKNLDANKIIIEAAGKNLKELAALNRKQLRDGFISTGERTDEYKSIYYNNLKADMGSFSVPHKDFFFHGDFHRGIYAKKISDENIEFGSTDKKSDFIEERESNDIFSVTPENLISAIDHSLVNIIDKTLIK